MENQQNISPERRALFDLLMQKQVRENGQQVERSNKNISTRPANSKYIPLSYVQESYWMLHQLIPESSINGITKLFRIIGHLDVQALEHSLNEIIRRHEVLRSKCVLVDGTPMQCITTEYLLSLTSIDLTTLSNSEQAIAIEQHIAVEEQYSYNFEEDLSIRVKLLLVKKEQDSIEHLFLLNLHHFVSDGWSMGLLYQELTLLYTFYSNKGKETQQENKTLWNTYKGRLPELPIQYGDYAYWQRQDKNAIFDKQLAYWLKQLADVVPIALPTDKIRPTIQSYKGATHHFTIDPILTQQLQKFSQNEGVTLFMTLLAAFQVLLYRYTQQQDILVATAVTNRLQKETENLIGSFANSLLLRVNVQGKLSFRELLAQVRHIAVTAYANQAIPFEQIIKKLTFERDTSRKSLFQVMFILHERPEDKLFDLDGLGVEEKLLDKTTSALDLSLSVVNHGNSLTASLQFNTDIFVLDTIKRLTRHFLSLLNDIVLHPTTKIHNLSLLTTSEKNQLLYEFNDTKTDFPQDKTLIDLFEEQVEKTPNNIAVVFEDTELTYRELNQKANQVGHYLRTAYNIQPDDIIALQIERSEWMMIAVLGVMKAGAAYLPLPTDDAHSPNKRVASMLVDSQATILLTQKQYYDSVADSFRKLISHVLFVEEGEAFSSYPTSNIINNRAHSSNAAYLLYTSGSTGTPKGVLTKHKAIVNRIIGKQEQFPLTTKDRVLQKTILTFDVSVWESFWPLLSGTTLVLAGVGGHRDATYLLNIIQQEKITNVYFNCSMLEAWIATADVTACTSLKRIFCGGEALSKSIIQQVLSKLNVELHNLYGPTEAAIYVSHWHCQLYYQRRIIPIGIPVSNVQLYIVDKVHQLVPIGVSGELLIGGVQIAEGYYKRPKLTVEKFIHHPFKEGDRLYKTGDLARWLPDGNIEFLGRMDNQLKIRGYRIEAGEIEQALLAHPAIQTVVVIGHETAGAKELVAYLVPIAIGKDQEAVENLEQAMPDIATLRSFLAESLPDYMIPAYYMQLDSLPLTSSGKVNRKALPSPDPDSLVSGIAYEGPSNPIEQTLVDLWEELLGRQAIGIHDNFFSLGGHSLRAIRLIALIHQKLDAKIKLTEVFAHPTIEVLAEKIVQIQVMNSVHNISQFVENDTQNNIEEIW